MNFVIIASPRTGSTHLVTTLSGHPEIFCNGNLFRKGRIQLFWPKSDLTESVIETLSCLREERPNDFLASVYSKNYGRKHVGFKIFNGQNDTVLSELIENSEIRKIVLFRRNVLANYSSWLAARRSGRYSQNVKVEPQPKVLFSSEEFSSFRRQYTSFYKKVLEKLNRHSQPFCFVSYEDINEPTLLLGICSFIGADSSKPICKNSQYRQLVKQNTSDILDRFSNPSEVRAYLRNNDLLGWRQEGETGLGFTEETSQQSTILEDV